MECFIDERVVRCERQCAGIDQQWVSVHSTLEVLRKSMSIVHEMIQLALREMHLGD